MLISRNFGLKRASKRKVSIEDRTAAKQKAVMVGRGCTCRWLLSVVFY